MSASDRRYSAELRTRGADGLWSSAPKRGDVTLAALVADHPSPAWAVAADRIVALLRGQHTRIEIDADKAIMLRRV